MKPRAMYDAAIMPQQERETHDEEDSPDFGEID